MTAVGALRSPRVSLGKWSAPVAVGLFVLVLPAALFMAMVAVNRSISDGVVGIDYLTHLEFARRFLDTGSMYLPSQLAGPYDPRPVHVIATVPSMYPPTAVYLFLPFLVLPAVLWWAIPLSVIGYAFWRWRPGPWTWAVLALCIGGGWTMFSLMVGNSNIWVVAGICAGLLWGWPAILVVLKPTLAPLALLGIRRRSWWIALAVAAALSLPLIGQWLDYVAVVRDSTAPLTYSFGAWPTYLIPFIAWAGRTREVREYPRAPTFASLRSWTAEAIAPRRE